VDVHDYLRELAHRAGAVLGDELVGVYAGGSLALGAYEPGRSDLDVAVVCRSPLAREAKERLAAALRHEALPCPARGLELVVYAEAVTQEPTAEPGYELDLNTGARMDFRLAFDTEDADPHWYVIDRAILHGHARAVSGPPAAEVFAEIPRALLLPALVAAVRWHATSGIPRGDDAVLNACRSLRFAEDGVWSAKPDAGRWALDRVADRELVAAALEGRSGAGTLPAERVAAFLAEVEARLAA
jgi:hypothetical protein